MRKSEKAVHDARCPTPLALPLGIGLALVLAILLPGRALAQSTSAPNCQMIASLPPVATLGGPATTAPGDTELGLAGGGYAEFLPSSCLPGGGEDWFVRLRHGVSNRMDLGFDVQADNQADQTYGATAKVAVRYQAKRGLRLEGGIGAADQGDGRSVNAEVAGTIGTTAPDKTWNYYASLRLAGSHGCINVFCAGGAGAGHPPGVYLHLSIGVLFDVGKNRKSRARAHSWNSLANG